MEFFLIFITTLIFLAFLLLALKFGRPPVYRPKRDEIIRLLQAVVDGQAQQSDWDTFLGLVIVHDPLLERARQACLAIDEGKADQAPAARSISAYIYRREGLEAVGNVLDQLREEINEELVNRAF